MSKVRLELTTFIELPYDMLLPTKLLGLFIINLFYHLIYTHKIIIFTKFN